MGRNGLPISHLQFVDYMMVFCKVDDRQVIFSRCILRCLEVVSGLRINLTKRSLIFGFQPQF